MLLGADVLEDFPDRIRARAGLDGVRFLVAVGPFCADAAANADVFLPTTVWGEKGGSATNLEGRVQRLAAVVTPEGTPMDDWRIAAELAARLGADFGLYTVDEVTDEIAAVAPAHDGVTAELLRRARDGAVAADRRAPRRAGVRGAHRVRERAVVGAHRAGHAGSRRGGRHRRRRRRRGRRVRADADAPTSARPRPRCTSGTGWPRHPRRCRPTRTVSASWPPARSTTPDAPGARAPVVAALAPGAALVVHPNDLARVGVQAEGEQVRVTSSRGTVTLPVRADAATAPGTAFVAFAQGGAVGASDLIDIEAAVTELRVETVR